MKGGREYILSSSELLGPLKDFLDGRGYGVYVNIEREGVCSGSIHNHRERHNAESCEEVSKFTWDGDTLRSSHKVTLKVRDSRLIDVIDSHFSRGQ